MSPGAEIIEEQKVTKEMAESLEEEVTLPYTVNDVTLMSPGRWNGVEWTAEEIENGLQNTTFEAGGENTGEIEQNNALFFEHDDRDARAWIGEVKNPRMEGKELVGDLVIVDEEPAIKLEYGAKFGVSAKVTGRTDGDTMRNMHFENFSLVLNPAVKTTFINSEMAELLQDIEVHEPEFEDTADKEWSSPDLEDFGFESWDELSNDEKSAVDDHFVVSKSGFPAEDFGDLALPVVEPDGTLNLNALANAKARAGQVSGFTGDELTRAKQIITRLANENFEDADFEPVENEELRTHPDFDVQAVDKLINDFLKKEGNSRESFISAFLEWADKKDVRIAVDAYVRGGNSLMDGVEELEDWLEMIPQKGEQSKNNSKDDIGGENITMTDEEPEPETDESPEQGEEAEEAEESVDRESLKNELLEEIREELQEDEESEDVEEEEVEDDEESEDVEEDEEASEDLSEFEEFVEEKKSENPDLSPSELADMFEEEQKSAEEKVEERVSEVKEEMASQIEDLKEKVTELSEGETEPARVSQASGEEVKELQEKVKNQDREELRKGVMRKMLDQAQASQLYEG